MRNLLALLTVVAALAVSASAFAAPSIAVEPPYPVLGQPAVVTLAEAPEGEWRLVATYRPNSLITRDEPVGAPGPDGRIEWTPTAPGITQLAFVSGEKGAKPAASRNVAVRFTGLPLTGLLVFLFAGTLLFGGAAYSIRLVMRESMPTGDDAHKVLADD